MDEVARDVRGRGTPTSILQAGALFSLGVGVLGGCTSREDSAGVVVVYTSEDQVFSEPVLEAFERETGIAVETPPDVPSLASLRVMRVDYAKLARSLEEPQPFLKEWAGY